MLKRYILRLTFLGLFLAGGSAQAAEKYVCVNLEKVFNQYERTKEEEDKLTQEGKEKQKQIDAKLSEIDKLKQEMELLSEKEKEKKKSELDKKMEELRQFDRQARADLMRKRDLVIRDILKEIDQAIQEYGKSNGYTMIFNTRAILYKDDKLDITEDVIKYLNRRYKKGDKK